MNEREKIMNSADPCELFMLDQQGTKVNFIDNELAGVKGEFYSGRGLRLVKDGKLSSVTGTESVSFDKLREMAEQSSPYGTEAVFDFPGSDAGASEETILLDEKIDNITTEELIATGRTLIETVRKRKPEYQVSAHVGKSIERVHILNSNGVDRKLEKSSCGFSVSAEKVDEGNIIEWYNGSERLVADDGLPEYLDEFFTVLDLCERPVNLDGGKYPVILHPDSLYFLLEALHSGLGGRSVFEGTSPLKDRIGELVLSEDFTFVDDPAWKDGPNFAPFDHEGVPVDTKKIFDGGVLRSYMTNLEYAARLGIEPTGHGYRRGFLEGGTYVGRPAIQPSNRIIETGDVPYSDMLKGIRSGILLYMSFDCWMGLLFNGDFSGSISMGFKIEDGALSGRIKNMQMSGNIYKFFGEQLDAISDTLVNPGFSADRFPYLLVKDVVIS